MHAAMGWRPRGQTVPPIRAREHLSSSTACAYTDSYACGSRILRYYAYECISRGTWHTWGTVACKSAVSLDALVRMPLVQQEVLVALREIVLLRRVRQVLSTEPTQRLRGSDDSEVSPDTSARRRESSNPLILKWISALPYRM